MAEGVESRVPFLDNDVVEFVASLPPSHKMQGLQEKAVLRRAAQPFMPSSLKSRKKRPFYTPIQEWFFSTNRPDFVDEALSRDAIRDAGLFDPSLVARYQRELRLAPDHTLMKNRLEWTLVLILQTQLLHKYFVKERCQKSPTAGAVV
jgi:asparagine synthase (glutamine-hydrolysing)